MRALYVPVLVFIAFGYMVTTPALLLSGGFLDAVNLWIRIAEVGFLIAIFAFSIFRAHIFSCVGALAPLILFFLIYGARLIYDVLFEGILMIYQSPTYVLGYFFGLTLLPVLGIAAFYWCKDDRLLFRVSFSLLIAANVLLFLYAVVTGDLSRGTFAGRIEEKGQIEGSAVLGPIWLGYAGSMLAAMLFGIFVTSHRLSWRTLAIGGALSGLCVANMLFGASRGPTLGLVLPILLFLLKPAFANPRITPLVSRAKGLIATLVLIGIAAVLIASSEGAVFLVERFASMYTERIAGGHELRDIIFAAAWEDFLSSPVIGSSYVVSFMNAEAHNIILESLMATGLMGSFFLFWALIRAFVGIHRLLNGMRGTEGVALALATICALVVGLTSSSIGQSPALWILVALVTVMSAPDLSVRKHAGDERDAFRQGRLV